VVSRNSILLAVRRVTLVTVQRWNFGKGPLNDSYLLRRPGTAVSLGTTRRGKPLTRLRRGMILYSTAFVFGAAYAILFQDSLGAFLHWREAWIAAIILWGILLAIVAWRRNYAHRSSDASADGITSGNSGDGQDIS